MKFPSAASREIDTARSVAPRSLASSKACRSTVPLSTSATTVPTCASLRLVDRWITATGNRAARTNENATDQLENR
ncbi:hypothetical protein, partial [Mycobacterium kansasii]